MAISQATRIADLVLKHRALDSEIAAKEAERDLGETNEERLAEARADKTRMEADLVHAQGLYDGEEHARGPRVDLRRRIAGGEENRRRCKMS